MTCLCFTALSLRASQRVLLVSAAMAWHACAVAPMKHCTQRDGTLVSAVGEMPVPTGSTALMLSSANTALVSVWKRRWARVCL